MHLLEYNVTHPYPPNKVFTVGTILLIAIILPVLVLVNIVTVGYELVPTLRSTFTPEDTVPQWWDSMRLPSLLRPQRPKCQPKDMGRGDVFRVSPSLFEYRVLSTWRDEDFSPEEEGRIEYTDGSFNECFVETIRFDYNMLEWTQSLRVGVACLTWPVWAFLETDIVFAWELSKDYVGQYYAFNSHPSYFPEKGPNRYRKSVFGVFDVITTESLAIVGKHLPAPVLSIGVAANISTEVGVNPRFSSYDFVYLNGTRRTRDSDDELGELEIYRDSISNTMNAVKHAVHLDLGNLDQGNIFINSSAVNQTFSPNLAPGSIDPDSWVHMATSWSYGSIPPPYRTWAEALRAGQPQNISLGLSLAGLPSNWTMVTNYLCPSYQLKSISPFLASIFVGTTTMFLSVWAAWKLVSAIVAQWMHEPCMKCTCESNIPATTDEEKRVGSHSSKGERPQEPEDTHPKDGHAS